MSSRSLVVKVTAGKDDPERCNQAFTVAATAAASGVPVSLWLTGEAAWFALPGRGAAGHVGGRGPRRRRPGPGVLTPRPGRRYWPARTWPATASRRSARSRAAH